MNPDIFKNEEVRKSYIGELSKEKLEFNISELRAICDELDPYSPISEEMKARLSNLFITEYFDPFALTNKLLVLLEDSLEEMEKYK